MPPGCAGKSIRRQGGNPVQTEVGADNRATPTHALRDTRKLGGTYIWELMIGKSWGDAQGVFYPDSTVRDPVIAAAIMGIFRNEGTTAFWRILTAKLGHDTAAAQR